MTTIDRGYWLEASTRSGPPAPAPRPAAYGVGGRRARTTVDTAGEALTTLTNVALLAPLNPDDEWRGFDLDSRTLSRMSPARILELLADLSPEVSAALWDFLRFVNPGCEATVVRPSGAKAPQTQQAQLLSFLARLTARYGAVDVVIARLSLGAFLRGAFVAELVLDSQGRQPVDLATPDPASVRFKRVPDPETGGSRWQPGQWISGEWRSIERPTVRYVPIDPFPASPYGRAPAAPSLFASLFLLAMLHDLKRVVQQQGYPRIDLSIDMAKLRELMPANLEDDPEAMAAWVSGTIREIQAVYAALEPDDAYVHPDVTTVNRPVGTLDASSLGAVDGLISALERMLVRGLKTVPILQGITDGVSEANVRVQWKLYQARLRAFQHTLEQLLGYLLSLAMEAQGVAARVEFTFAQSDLIDRLIDAQTDETRVRVARAAYDHGYLSQDEAAKMAVGKDRADVPEPRVRAGGSAVGAPPAPAGVSGEQGGAA